MIIELRLKFEKFYERLTFLDKNWLVIILLLLANPLKLRKVR